MLSEGSQTDFIKSVNVSSVFITAQDTAETNFGTASQISDGEIVIDGKSELTTGNHSLVFQMQVKEDAVLTHRFSVEKAILSLGGKGLAIDVDKPYTIGQQRSFVPPVKIIATPIVSLD